MEEVKEEPVTIGTGVASKSSMKQSSRVMGSLTTLGPLARS